MTDKVGKIKCLFGHHKYTLVRQIRAAPVLICEYCEAVGVCNCPDCRNADIPFSGRYELNKDTNVWKFSDDDKNIGEIL